MHAKGSILKSLHFLSAVVSLMFSGVFLVPSSSFGQATARDTLKVIYHDFEAAHPDFGGPSPDQQQKCNGGLNSNLVTQTLNATDKVPRPSGAPRPSPNTAAEIAECNDLNIPSWFAPKAGDPGFLRTFNGYLLDQGLPNDGKFQYSSDAFFPLDTVTGATRYANGHNNLFCLEVHTKFTYKGGEVFNFTGDDDVWLYINNRMAMDLGGLHGAVNGNVNLDAQSAALQIATGNTYDFDFYYCERQYSDSHIRIETNIPIAASKVANPVATPGNPASPTPFNSQLNVTLSTTTSGATIHYTTDGSTPDSTSPVYPAAGIPITATTTLKAIATKPDWKPSDVVTWVYTKSFVASTLDILDQNGNPLPGYLSELNPSYTIRVTTTQANLTSITTPATTKTAADAENVTITNPTKPGDYFVFTGSEPFVIGAATASNGKSEASPWDSLIVRWVNPSDPTRDIAEKRVLVRPAPKQAQVFFSTTAAGTPVTDSLEGTETTIYVFVRDEILRTTDSPTIKLTTTPGAAHGNGAPPDVESLPLTVVSPGLYRAAVPATLAVTIVPGNSSLQLLSGDQIRASYVDPVDKDSASANAGYGVPAEIDANLSFTDKDGNDLASGIFWSPAEGNLYLSYRDDFIASDTVEIVTLTIVNKGSVSGPAPGDSETVKVRLNLAARNGSMGIWEGSIKLLDGPSITKGNGTAETYILGQVHAALLPHNKAGDKQTTPISDDLQVAYPNKSAEIDVEGSGGPGVEIKRGDTTLIVRITDQSPSSVRDTLSFTLSCSVSGDQFVVRAIETGPNTGIFQSEIIRKAEGDKVNDNALQCLSHDFIKVSYTDPVYPETKTYDKELIEVVPARLYYASDAAGQNAITSVSDAEADFFYVVVSARNPNINAADHLPVTLAIAGSGETETFDAVETGNATNIFIAKVPFAFVTGASAAGNQILEGKITASNIFGVVTANGKATVDNAEVTGSINLQASFDKVVKAYIKDVDGDGKADKVYIEFEKRLPRVPDQVVAHWNSNGPGDAKTAAKPKISFLGADSLTVVLDFSGDEWPAGATAINADNPPKALLPKDALFQEQNPLIEDSIGPVVTKAVKHPVNPNLVDKGDASLNQDTLYVTVSEPVKSSEKLKQMLKFGSCSDLGKARVITAVTEPVLSTDPKDPPNTYILVIDNNTGLSPSANRDCILLNTDGRYTDMAGNLPPVHGVKLEGSDGKKLIELFRGYPPVAGLNPNGSSYQVSVQDNRDSTKGGYASIDPATGKYVVFWIPPVGFDPANPSGFRPYEVNVNTEVSSIPESQEPVSIPEEISAVQVVSKEPYIAHISIYDNLGNFIRGSVQAFGFKGELLNNDRIVRKGRVSFLVWDQKDTRGQFAGNGVYVWKVQFQFKGGKQEVQYTRTGIMRKKR